MYLWIILDIQCYYSDCLWILTQLQQEDILVFYASPKQHHCFLSVFLHFGKCCSFCSGRGGSPNSLELWGTTRCFSWKGLEFLSLLYGMTYMAVYSQMSFCHYSIHVLNQQRSGTYYIHQHVLLHLCKNRTNVWDKKMTFLTHSHTPFHWCHCANIAVRYARALGSPH